MKAKDFLTEMQENNRDMLVQNEELGDLFPPAVADMEDSMKDLVRVAKKSKTTKKDVETAKAAMGSLLVSAKLAMQGMGLGNEGEPLAKVGRKLF